VEGIAKLAGFGSIVEPLVERVDHGPDETALFLIGDDDSERRVSVGQLHAAATMAAAALADRGVGPGQVVILALRHSLDLIAGLWGVLYRGGIPSLFPYLPPQPNAAALRAQLQSLVAQSGAAALMTFSELRPGLAEVLAPLGCRVLDDAGFFKNTSQTPPRRPLSYLSNEQIAYLQYTSGTTGLQKGVRLSHRAILNCVSAFARAMELSPDDVVVNWLPLYHDYGLFAGMIMGLLTGIPVVLMSPFKWVRKPESLLAAIHRHRGTLSWMPNSAYSHTTANARPERLAGLDLSSLRCLGCAAEPIMFRTQELFLERFAPYGFKEAALMTGYGMAENSLAITVSPNARRAPVDWVDGEALVSEGQARPGRPGAPRHRPMVSSGSPVEGVELRIVDKAGHPLAERGVGEIVIRSESMFSGYHRRPDLTEAAVRQGWFRTGDMGYVAEGQLYVCGRKKDLIIQAGHNIHPEDVEAVAASTRGLEANRVVAFGVPDEALGTEKIVLVCETVRSLDEGQKLELERTLRRQVFRELGVTLGEVRFPERRWIVKTHNGKISRSRCLEKYLAESKQT
jgi:fatty-acyl-CoA synthase